MSLRARRPTTDSAAGDRTRHDRPAPRRNRLRLYQSSTWERYWTVSYDGEVTVAELLRHGDFGLGTFNHLDGEMVVLDGICYHLRADGSAKDRGRPRRTPFAAVTRSEPGTPFPFTRPTGAGRRHRADRQPDPAKTSLRDAESADVQRHDTRTVMAQTPPYPPLIEATARPGRTPIQRRGGTLAGFRTPDYDQGISVAGYHLHFLDENHSRAVTRWTSE